MTPGSFYHQSVLPQQTLDCLAPHPGGTYLDGTLGGGGHSRLILEASAPDGLVIGLDRDEDALAHAATVLAPYGQRAILRHARFTEAPQVLAELGIEKIDGALLDLGVSSWQLDAAHRGFSFRNDGPLDMRMDRSSGPTAADLINTAEESELVRIFREYGEERFAGRIARNLVRLRQEHPLTRTAELAEAVCNAIPGGHIPGRIHPATRVFQALRIAVNAELDQVRTGIDTLFALLKPGGRLAIISFHSLEDRIVKQAFAALAEGCRCPRGLPVCACGHEPAGALLTRRGIRGADADAENPRARSAVLRAIRKL